MRTRADADGDCAAPERHGDRRRGRGRARREAVRLPGHARARRDRGAPRAHDPRSLPLARRRQRRQGQGVGRGRGRVRARAPREAPRSRRDRHAPHRALLRRLGERARAREESLVLVAPQGEAGKIRRLLEAGQSRHAEGAARSQRVVEGRERRARLVDAVARRRERRVPAEGAQLGRGHALRDGGRDRQGVGGRRDRRRQVRGRLVVTARRRLLLHAPPAGRRRRDGRGPPRLRGGPLPQARRRPAQGPRRPRGHARREVVRRRRDLARRPFLAVLRDARLVLDGCILQGPAARHGAEGLEAARRRAAAQVQRVGLQGPLLRRHRRRRAQPPRDAHRPE